MEQFQEFSTRLEKKIRERLIAYCKTSGRSIMWVVNKAVAAFLDKEDRNTEKQ